MIKIAQETDIDHCLDLLQEYHPHSAYRILPFDRQATRDSLLGVMADGLVLVGPEQILVAKKILAPFSKEPLAAEIALFSTSKTREKVIQEHELHEAFTYWAKHVANVKVIQDGAFGNTNYFRKRGYLQAETIYLVRI